jgi:Sortase domain
MHPNFALLRSITLIVGYLVGGAVFGVALAFVTASHRQALPASPVQLAQPRAAATVATPVVADSSPAPTIPAAATATPSPTPTPQTAAAASPYGPNRLIIPSFGIDSTWLPLGWLPNGVTMDSPPGPEDLGWYTFTAQPGSSSNAVFSGHVDWHTGAPALFAHLASLDVGAEIDISRADGVLVRYHVISSASYGLYQTAAAPIIAPTAVPTVTLITCDGTFDQTSHEYDQRLIIRAVGNGF